MDLNALAPLQAQNQWVLGLCFALALAWGVLLQRSHFCTMGAISDVVLMGDGTRLRQWVLVGLDQSPEHPLCVAQSELAEFVAGRAVVRRGHGVGIGLRQQVLGAAGRRQPEGFAGFDERRCICVGRHARLAGGLASQRAGWT